MRGAKNLAELKALKEEALRPKPAAPATPPVPPAGTPPAEATPPDLAAAKPTEETPAEAGDTPESAETPSEDSDADEADADEGAADGPPEIPTAKSIRLSPAQHDKVGRLTTTLMRRNRDWTMEQAMEAAKDQLGLNPKPEPEAPAPGQQSDMPKTVDEVDQSIEQLEAAAEAAQVGLRFEDAAKISKQIRALDRHRLKLERDAERAETEKVTSYQTAFVASAERAFTLYPFAADPNSAGAKRMLEIDAALKANGDPLYDSPDRPLKVAQMAAAELNIAPLRKGATPPKPPTGAAPAAVAPKKQVLAAGASQSTPAPANQKPADLARVEGIKTLADLRAERKRLGLPEN